MSIYRNGNYLVRIDKNGTKDYFSFKLGEDLNADFPDSLDIKLTNKCFRACPYCHENSTGEGENGNLEEIYNVLSKLPKVPIELAFGGGNITHLVGDEFEDFLKKLKSRGYKISTTLHYKDFAALTTMDKGSKIISLLDSVGVSVTLEDSNIFESMILMEQSYKALNKDIEIVYHLVLGTFSRLDLAQAIKKGDSTSILSSQFRKLKILFLGYKEKGRGEEWDGKPKDNSLYFKELKNFIINNFIRLREFDSLGRNYNVTCGFDNLALLQLNLREAFTSKEWEKRFMGDDFSHSMYIDGVTKTFAPSSTSPIRIPWSEYDSDPVKYFKENHKEHGK